MIAYHVFCDLCGSDKQHGTLEDVQKNFKTIRLNGKTVNICNECKKIYSRSGLYKALINIYPNIRKNNGRN
jgi:hypothetical protein